MKLPLPAAVYHLNLPGPSSTSLANARYPSRISKWIDFEANATQWITANAARHMDSRLAYPTFSARLITQEVPTLHPFLKDNLLDVASLCCSDCDFVSWAEIVIENQGGGEPDFAMQKNGILAAPIEIKGNWSVPDADLVGDYANNNNVRGAIVQIYTYTWFPSKSENGLSRISKRLSTAIVTQAISTSGSMLSAAIQSSRDFNKLLSSISFSLLMYSLIVSFLSSGYKIFI